MRGYRSDFSSCWHSSDGENLAVPATHLHSGEVGWPLPYDRFLQASDS